MNRFTTVAFAVLAAIFSAGVAGQNTSACPAPPKEMCCTRTISNPRATLAASFTAPHALTSITIWDQSGTTLLQKDSQFMALDVSIGTKESMSGCFVTNPPQMDEGSSAPAGFEEKGLLCGSSGTYLTVSVSKLVGMWEGPSKPKDIAVKICTASAPASAVPRPAKLFITSRAAAPLQCFTNAPMGLVLRDLEWFNHNHHGSMDQSPVEASMARCFSYRRFCQSASSDCSSKDVGSYKTIFGLQSQDSCSSMLEQTDVYRDLHCCSTHGCNHDPNPAPAPPTPTPMACQVIGVQVESAIPAINADSNCDGKGKCYNMTVLQMKNYIGTPHMDALEPNHFSCIDGRHDNEIVATPAGDMGIFLSSAFVYINGTSTPTDFSLVRIKMLLRDFILTFRKKTTRFYYHTDQHSVHAVVEELQRLNVDGGSDIEDFCSPSFVPSPAAREPLLTLLANPDVGVGCGHVKYMAKYPADYGITSADLVINTIRALWELKWGELREYINVEPLGHEHTEQAVLSITSINGCDGFTPLITQRTANDDADPSGSDAYYSGQIFVNHDHSVKVIRNKVSRYFVDKGMDHTTPSEFRARVDNLADNIQLMKSASLLAQYRPLYTATINGELYVPDHWNDTEPSAFLMCYVGTPAGLVLRETFSDDNPHPVFNPLRCVSFSYMCQSADHICGADEVGTSKTVFGFGKQSDCSMMMSHSGLYKDLKCCSTDGCNFRHIVGPTPDILGPPSTLMCQLVGVRIAGPLIPAIAADSNCGGGNCYNWTKNQMKDYIGSPAMVPLEPNHFSCIDGRHDDEIVATPAGDMGIFLSSVFVYINATNTPNDFALPRIKGLLTDFILSFRSKTTKFYYHTDHHSMESIIEHLKSLNISDAESFEHLCDAGFIPRPDVQETLLQLLTDPAVGIGCGHVKYMLMYPADYGITSAALVKNTIQALWQLKWGELRDYIEVEPLGHEHTEQAVLSITGVEGCDGFTPLVTQRVASADGPPGPDSFYANQIFVNHDHSVKVLRNKVAQYFTKLGGPSLSITTPSFRSKLDTLADDIQLMKSASLLAKYRPLFSATITGRLYVPDTRRSAKGKTSKLARMV